MCDCATAMSALLVTFCVYACPYCDLSSPHSFGRRKEGAWYHSSNGGKKRRFQMNGCCCASNATNRIRWCSIKGAVEWKWLFVCELKLKVLYCCIEMELPGEEPAALLRARTNLPIKRSPPGVMCVNCHFGLRVSLSAKSPHIYTCVFLCIGI